MKYRVSYDRPRGLSSDGYHALVNDEPGPHGLAHVAAMCRRWNVSAGVREWNAHSFFHGRVGTDGALTKPSEHHPESRAYYEKNEALKAEYLKRLAKQQAASLAAFQAENRRAQGGKKARR